MKVKMLAVAPQSEIYLNIYDVDVARSFYEAKEMIMSAEADGRPYATLDLPVSDEKEFWNFIEWMEKSRRRYSFSIFGAKNEKHFIKIAKKAREKGFEFNS